MRLVSSKSCKVCEGYRQRLNDAKYSYEVFDADDNANSAQLDAWLITKFPVVQIVEIMDNGTRVVKSQWPQGQDPPVRWIDFKIKQLEEKQQNEVKSRATKSS